MHGFRNVYHHHNPDYTLEEVILIRDQLDKPAVYFRGVGNGIYYPAGNMSLGEDGIDGYMKIFDTKWTPLTEDECHQFYAMVGNIILAPEFDV